MRLPSLQPAAPSWRSINLMESACFSFFYRPTVSFLYCFDPRINVCISAHWNSRTSWIRKQAQAMAEVIESLKSPFMLHNKNANIVRNKRPKTFLEPLIRLQLRTDQANVADGRFIRWRRPCGAKLPFWIIIYDVFSHKRHVLLSVGLGLTKSKSCKSWKDKPKRLQINPRLAIEYQVESTDDWCQKPCDFVRT
jgi:hypothetical protein